VREALLRLLTPEVEALGFELVELEFNQHHGGGLLRIYIDRLPGHAPAAMASTAVPEGLPPEPSEAAFEAQSQGGVHVDDCEAVSRRVSDVLDATDPIKGEYTLEVSSPGFDRPLRTHAHFVRFAGSRVKVETSVPRDGRRRWTGCLVEVQDATIVLEVDGQPVELALEDIRHARVVPDYGPRPAGGAKNGRE
jgi:ribosome maturation factor RimP